MALDYTAGMQGRDLLTALNITSTRYDKLIESFAASVQLACIRIWIRFVHTT
jgi:transposase